MDYIALKPEELDTASICCGLAGAKEAGVLAKKAWLRERMAEGLVFLKADVRGKCFIEYLPAERAFAPIEAEGYMFIDCFWVAGSLKGQGHGAALLFRCIEDSRQKGKRGVCLISSKKKRPFLSDSSYMTAKGFRVADTAEPYFTLLYLPFEEEGPLPRFRSSAKKPAVAGEGFALYYTRDCPYTTKYVPLVAKIAEEEGLPFTATLLDSREAAQAAPVVWTTYALFIDGQYITNEILSEKKFLALAQDWKKRHGA